MSTKSRILFVIVHFSWIILWLLASGLRGKVPNVFDDVLWGTAITIAVSSTVSMVRTMLRLRR